MINIGIILTSVKPQPSFVFDLCKMLVYSTNQLPKDKYQIHIEGAGTSVLPQLRQNLAKVAVKKKYDWTLWLDDDMRFPPDTLLQLLAHKKAIVGCNYVTKKVPPDPTALYVSDDGLSFKKAGLPPRDHKEALYEVDALGFGCILIKTEVFEKMPLPWFNTGWIEEIQNYFGEDVWFCRSAKTEGYKIYCDHRLSRELGHSGIHHFMWDDAEACEAITTAPKLAPLISVDGKPLKQESKKIILN